jgi:NADH-quinone oxidoreductase subunit L
MILNRIGDFGLALAIFTIYNVFGSLDYFTVFAAAPLLQDTYFCFFEFQIDTLTLICIFLFVGCAGKSAQLGLHT